MGTEEERIAGNKDSREQLQLDIERRNEEMKRKSSGERIETPLERHARMQQEAEQSATDALLPDAELESLDEPEVPDPTQLRTGFGELPVGPGNILPLPQPDQIGGPYLNGKALKIISETSVTGEPVFVFRAKDLLSVMVIAHYLELAEKFSPDDPNFQEQIAHALTDFRMWQREHTDQVRYPD